MSSSVRRADRYMKPRCAKRTPTAPISVATSAHLWDQVVRSEAERTGLLRKAFRVCAPVNVWLSNAGTQFCEEHLSAQPVGGDVGLHGSPWRRAPRFG